MRFRDHTKTAFDVLASGDEKGTKVENQDLEEEKVIGELRLRGESVARKYWMDGEEVDMKMEDGWFNTGDIVQYSKGCYKVWGRLNMANINHKGKMVNASSIEKKVLSHKDIDDCYVVGIGDIQVGTFKPLLGTNVQCYGRSLLFHFLIKSLVAATIFPFFCCFLAFLHRQCFW